MPSPFQQKELKMARPRKIRPEEGNTMTMEPTTPDIATLQAELRKAQEELAKVKQATEVQSKNITMGNSKEAKRAVIEEQKRQDSRMVRGRFLNRRAPGQTVKLTYMKYEDDPVKWYEFRDGGTYEIPRGFADQINEYYHTPIFTQTEQFIDPSKPSSSIANVDTSVKKYAFVDIEYL